MRKLIIVAVVGFVVYFLFTNPEGAAGLVEGAWNAVVGFFDAVLEFVGALFD